MYQTLRPLERDIAESETLRYQAPKSIGLRNIVQKREKKELKRWGVG